MERDNAGDPLSARERTEAHTLATRRLNFQQLERACTRRNEIARDLAWKALFLRSYLRFPDLQHRVAEECMGAGPRIECANLAFDMNGRLRLIDVPILLGQFPGVGCLRFVLPHTRRTA